MAWFPWIDWDLFSREWRWAVQLLETSSELWVDKEQLFQMWITWSSEWWLMASERLKKNMMLWTHGWSISSSLTRGDRSQLKFLNHEHSASERIRYFLAFSDAMKSTVGSLKLTIAFEEMLNIWLPALELPLSMRLRLMLRVRHWQLKACWATEC